MISLKRNNKKILVKAKGCRVKKSSIYEPNQKESFSISRGKFADFLSCPRCFYLDRVKGLETPSMPGWALNTATDVLYKKEFDFCRDKQIAHRLFKKNGLENFVPFDHPDMDKWRDSRHHGLKIKYKNTNIFLTGGVDDIWQDKVTGKLAVVDYKSQASEPPNDPELYFQDPFHEGYKIQMDFYCYLLIKMGFKVCSNAFFLVCNADKSRNEFNTKMNFTEHIIPYKWNIDWIEEKIDEMVKLINQFQVPKSHESCMNCAYSEQYLKIVSS